MIKLKKIKKKEFFLPNTKKGIKCYICERQGELTSESKCKRIYPHHIRGHNKGQVIYLCETHHTYLVEIECEKCGSQKNCTRNKFKTCWNNGYIPKFFTPKKKNIKKEEEISIIEYCRRLGIEL